MPAFVHVIDCGQESGKAHALHIQIGNWVAGYQICPCRKKQDQLKTRCSPVSRGSIPVGEAG